MIEVGDPLPGLSLAPKDASGNAVDPGAVTLAITLPDQTLATPTVNRSGVGQYSATYMATQAGTHVVEWTATGAYAGTFRDTVEVELRSGIVSLSDIKDFLGIRRSTNDEILRLMGVMASDLCESPEGTNRRWRRRIVTDEKHTAAGTFQLFNAPVLEITSLTANGTTLSADDYDIDTVTGLVYDVNGALSTGTRRFGISVSYIAGSVTVPAAVRNGVLEMVRHLYHSHSGGSSLPSQDEPDYTTSLAYLIPNRVAVAWSAYRMPG